MKQQQISEKKQTTQQNRIQQGVKSKTFSSVLDHPYIQAQAIIGNHGLLRCLRSDIIQAKLILGSPSDKYEIEADRVAEQVMRMPEPEVQAKSA